VGPTATPTATPVPPTATPTDTPVPATDTPTPTATSAPATPTPTRTPTPTSVPGSPVLTFFTANGFTVASVNYSGFTPGVTYRLKVFRSVDTTVSVGDMGLGFVDFVSATSSGVFNFPIGDGNNFPLGAGINFPTTDPGFDYYLLAQLRESPSTAVFYGIYHLPASPVFVHGGAALADRVTVLTVSTAEIADGVRVKLGNPSFTYATGDVTGINIHTYAGNEFISAVSLAAPIALTVYAGDGNDTVITGSGADIIRGGAGSDVLNGQGGADSITGDAGNDTLYAGGGCSGDGAVDRLDGGADTDTAYHVGAGDRLFNIETIIGC
ncbi:MAG: calcium-binding protein, partial [Anaerolineae bacterium]